MDIEGTVKKVNEIIKNSEEYKDDDEMQVQYVLLNKDNKIDDIVCYGLDGMLRVDPKTFNIDTLPDWAFNYDTDLFEQLQNGKTIGYMTADVHYDIWCNINDLYPEDINCKEGLELYIKYCDKNGITKDYLDKMIYSETPDIMENFTNLEKGEILEYKGYIAYVDEPNIDNDKENIVYIYKNKDDYLKEEYIESVSLNKDGIKKYIKSYIDETYNPQMSIPNYESNKSYFAFVLGYDLLQEMFKNSTVQECDKIYDFCNYEAEQFLASNEFKNLKYSGYEMLELWLKLNKEQILADYKNITNGEPSLYNGDMKIIEKGFRNNQPIALVEKDIDDNTREYIIAFYYETDKDKLSWGYAYYYDTNIVKAKNDFDKVLKGGNLANTFEKKTNDMER